MRNNIITGNNCITSYNKFRFVFIILFFLKFFVRITDINLYRLWICPKKKNILFSWLKHRQDTQWFR